MQESLFKPVTRDERQEEAKQKWIKNKGKGTIEACTGFIKKPFYKGIYKIIIGQYR